MRSKGRKSASLKWKWEGSFQSISTSVRMSWMKETAFWDTCLSLWQAAYRERRRIRLCPSKKFAFSQTFSRKVSTTCSEPSKQLHHWCDQGPHCNENRRLLPWKQMTETLSCLEVHRCMKVGWQKHIELNKLNTKTHSTELVWNAVFCLDYVTLFLLQR